MKKAGKKGVAFENITTKEDFEDYDKQKIREFSKTGDNSFSYKVYLNEYATLDAASGNEYLVLFTELADKYTGKKYYRFNLKCADKPEWGELGYWVTFQVFEGENMLHIEEFSKDGKVYKNGRYLKKCSTVCCIADCLFRYKFMGLV